MKNFASIILTFLPLVCACEKIDITPHVGSEKDDRTSLVSMKDIAQLLSCGGLGLDQVGEVHDAVSASLGNGYDEEYTMKDIFTCPGAGVGSGKLKSDSPAKAYARPLREVFERYYSTPTRSGDSVTAEEYLSYIENSGMQIYWPYSEKWDGSTFPIITFDPLSDTSVNTGYLMEGGGTVKEVTVTEETARERPVWVVNRNDDAAYSTLEMIRLTDPEWSPGGSLIVKSGASEASPGCKTLVLKEFTMTRNYDGWFAGASEFFVKIASVDAFTARTENEMYMYNPNITDFMVVVKRGQVGIPQVLNTVLVSEWTSQLESCALMIIEDDGGTQTSWDCSAVVKYNSKSYGFEVKIPYNSRDDIVWRGSLGRRYIEAAADVTGYFGDVQLVFSIQDM